jgi:hypothetical protein
MKALAFHRTAAAVAELVTSKNAAYGDSFSTAGAALRLLYPNGIDPSQMDDALSIARVWDKLSRIATANDPTGESPWTDIAGYAILALSRNSQEKSQCASASVGVAQTVSRTATDSAAANAGRKTATRIDRGSATK